MTKRASLGKAGPVHADTLTYVLLDVALVLVLVRLLAGVLARLGQPPVMAEILAGIALGPSIFGALAPAASASLFSVEATQMLSAIGSLGLVVFMFFVGLEVDYGTARAHRRTVGWVALGSLLAPLACGVVLGLSLYPAHATVAGEQVPKVAFVLFVCVALAVTAFPVLARILHDHGLDGTRLGTIAMSVAAVHDVSGWLLLALALAAASGDTPLTVLWTALAVAGLAIGLLKLARPLLRRRLAGADLERGAPAELAVVLVLLLLCAGFTEAIGLHAVIGAFLFGVAFPRDAGTEVVASLRRALLPLTLALLLPIYFLGPGLNFDLGTLGAGGLAGIALIVVVSCAATLVGTAAGASYAGLSRRDAGILGVLLNTRGLVELIILNIGFTAGVLGQALYSEFVVMALLTTLLTSPILRLAMRSARGELWQRALADA
ncbi:MAG TPA: cation:proton antiporter [Solirubrobacterales bacterium]